MNRLILIAILTTLAIVLVWRGMWGLADEYLLPNSLVASYIISLVVGVVMIYYLNKFDLLGVPVVEINKEGE